MSSPLAGKSTNADDETLVTLYQMPRSRFAPNPSPPCMKVECFMRLAGIPHRVITADRPGPAGRWPWIEYKGDVICDSTRIIPYLTAKFGVPMDAALTPAQQADGTILRRLCEEHIYYCASRHVLVDNIGIAQHISTLSVPTEPLLHLLMSYIRSGTIDVLNAGTIGDLTYEEYHREWLRNLEAIVEILKRNTSSPSAEGPFILGTAKPTSFDCVVFSHIVYSDIGKAFPELVCPAIQFIMSDPTIRAYEARMRELAYPDMAALLAPYKALPLRSRGGGFLTVPMIKWLGLAILIGVCRIPIVARMLVVAISTLLGVPPST